MIWHCVPGWDHNYEMTTCGKVRHILSSEVLKPIFIGPDGVLGFLMKKGMCWFLKPLHEVYAETFPELAKVRGEKTNQK